MSAGPDVPGFGDELPVPQQRVLCDGLKQGRAGIEAGIAPPTLNFLEPDPACPVDPVAEGPRKVDMRFALSNSFAFGGLNVTLALARSGEATTKR